MISAIIDGVIILLLIGSTLFGYLVSRKVRLLTATLKELEPLVDAFSHAVDKSELSVAHLRESIVDAEATRESRVEDETPEPQLSFRAARGAGVMSEARAGIRSVRDKQELVRAFFDATDRVKA